MNQNISPEQEYEDAMNEMDLSGVPSSTKRIVKVPFIWDAIGGRSTVVLMFKILVVITAIILIWRFLGPWSFLGLVPIPFWYSYIKGQLAEEHYRIIEVRIPGQKILDPAGGKVEVLNRGINMFMVPPKIFKMLPYTGSPWMIGEKTALVNYFDPEMGFIAYADRPQFNNLIRYYDDLWLKVVESIPRLERSIFIHKEKIRLLTMRNAVELLDQIHAQDRFYLGKQRLRTRKICWKGGWIMSDVESTMLRSIAGDIAEKSIEITGMDLRMVNDPQVLFIIEDLKEASKLMGKGYLRKDLELLEKRIRAMQYMEWTQEFNQDLTKAGLGLGNIEDSFDMGEFDE